MCALRANQVEALAGKRVLHAACGVWHSAAVAADLLLGSAGSAGSAPPDFFTELGYAEGLAAAQKLAAAYELLDQARSWLLLLLLPLMCGTPACQEVHASGASMCVLLAGATCELRDAAGKMACGVEGLACREMLALHQGLTCWSELLQEGGSLYTWGGECGWPEGNDAHVAAGQAGGRGCSSHHHGCLGHGDLQGRLLPERCPACMLLLSDLDIDHSVQLLPGCFCILAVPHG